MTELFPIEETLSLSPYEQWKRSFIESHKVWTLNCPEDKEQPWAAKMESEHPICYGKTEREALVELAVSKGIKLWNEEGMV